MQIKIEKSTYDSLSRDNKLRYIYIQTDPKFEKLIARSRKRLNIGPEDWSNPESYLYSTDKDHPLFTTSSSGELIPYGGWGKRRKVKEEFRKNAIKEVRKLLKRYPILNFEWFSFLYGLVCFDNVSSLPGKYSFIPTEKDGVFYIQINDLTNPSNLSNWVKKNWDYFKQVAGENTLPHFKDLHKKKLDIPTFATLEDTITIRRLKNKGKGSSFIANTVDKTGKTDETRIDKIYSNINKQLKKLEQESLKKKKIETSLFGR